jgi:hypothetical protein
VLYADNGHRGIAARWGRELTALAAAFGRKRGLAQSSNAGSHSPTRLSSATAPPPERRNPPVADLEGVSAPDRAAIDRLRTLAAQRGMTLTELVDDLLSARKLPESEASASALFGEVKGLFEKLATDIPTQLARGMEPAFRDLVRRMEPAASAVSPKTPSPSRAPANVEVELVRTEAAPREVASYGSRRRKTHRVKL